MKKENLIKSLNLLPDLWATESLDTSQILLPFRFNCKWHNLSWYPAEFDRKENICFGLTLKTVPKWRHFYIEELLEKYQRQPVELDTNHIPLPATELNDITKYLLTDLSPFIERNATNV